MPLKSPYFLAPILVLALSAPAIAEPTLVGIWYSPFQPDEPNVMSLIEFEADGTFHEEFRKCAAGDFIGYQTESGTWSVSGDVEHVAADMINGERAQVENDYKIVMLTDTQRRIQLEPQGLVFIGHRVMSFEFPDCATRT
jgi:hypothetical protein